MLITERNLLMGQILQKIEEFDNIILHHHIRADSDAVGSQGGLQKLLELNYPDKQIRAVGERLGNLSFLNQLEKEPLAPEEYTDALVIVCDTATQGRISQGENVNKGLYLIKIDHHPNHDSYGNLQWVEPDYSSTSEMIYDLYKYAANWKMNDEAARLLYAGIVGDTGRFLFSNVHPSTFTAAAELVSYNFDREAFYTKYYEKSRNLAKVEGDILSNFIKTDKGVAYHLVTKQMIDEYGISSNGVSRLVNVMKEVRGNKIWVLFIEGETEIRVNIRSSGVDIENVAIQFNGGGHENSAGATLYDLEDIPKVITALEQLL